MCNPGRCGFKAWVQNGQLIRPKDRCRQIRGLLEGDAPSEHEWTHINKPRDVAKREEHHADVEKEVAEFETKYAKTIDEDAKILALRSIMLETLLGEAGVLRGNGSSRTLIFARQSSGSWITMCQCQWCRRAHRAQRISRRT